MLSHFSVLVVDEAHERSLQTDMVLSLAKAVQAERSPPLKLLVMSATLETDAFCKYLSCEQGPVRVEGRQFGVSVWYSHAPQEDYIEAAVRAAVVPRLPPGLHVPRWPSGHNELADPHGSAGRRHPRLPHRCV